MSVLYGAIQASGGTAHVCGHHATVDRSYVRRSVGVCLQFDHLFPQLTVREHLMLYTGIKGVPLKLQVAAVQQVRVLLVSRHRPSALPAATSTVRLPSW